MNHAIETTLLVASNEYKYLAKVRTEFAELPPVVCNAGELNQVFLNLIVNAAHAIHDAGRDVSTGEITVSTAVAADEVVIRVRDNGCGVPAENLSKLYDPFFHHGRRWAGAPGRVSPSRIPSWSTSTAATSRSAAAWERARNSRCGFR